MAAAVDRAATAPAQIEGLLYRYAELIDAGDFAGLGALFADGCIIGARGQVRRGADAVRAMYEQTTRRYPDGTPRTRHVITNPIVTIDPAGDRATARSCFTVLQAVEGFPLQAIVAGRYEDRFDRAVAGWRFAERRMLVDLVGDVSRHLLIDLHAVVTPA